MFCNKCGTQIPDGIPTCPNCGAVTNVAAPKAPSQGGSFVNPFAAGLNKATILASAKSLNIPGLVLALLGFICIFLPGVQSGDEARSLISYEFVSLSRVSLISLIIAFMIGFGILYMLKKDMLAFLLSIVNFVFTLICFCVANGHFKDYYGGVKMGWGFIVYLILSILMIAPAIIWPTIEEMMKNKPQRVVYQQPVYQQPIQQPVYQQPVQQPMYQQPVQQAPQQPVYQQPVQQAPQQPVYQQPQEPQAPQQ